MSLWGNDVSIEILGVTGDHGSGKTLFCLSIDPKRTLVFDFENSSGSYMGLGFDRVSIPNLMSAKYPQGYTQEQVALFVIDYIVSVPQKYGLILMDPITDFEVGFVEWVKSQHKKFGFSTAKSFSDMVGVFWGKVKEEFKMFLSQISGKCETFCFTTHLRTEFKSGRSTGKKIPKGKETLFELASLYLWLDRSANDAGEVPDIPRADVLKSRLAHTSFVDGRFVATPMLPPRLPQATPDAIRQYIISPPDYKNLKPSEMVVEKDLSDEDRLRMEMVISENKKEAARSISEVETIRAGTARDKFMRAQNPDKAAELQKQAASVRVADARVREEQDASANPDAETAPGEEVTPEQLGQLVELKQNLGIDVETFNRIISRRTGGINPSDLSREQAEDILGKLQSKLDSIPF